MNQCKLTTEYPFFGLTLQKTHYPVGDDRWPSITIADSQGNTEFYSLGFGNKQQETIEKPLKERIARLTDDLTKLKNTHNEKYEREILRLTCENEAIAQKLHIAENKIAELRPLLRSLKMKVKYRDNKIKELQEVMDSITKIATSEAKKQPNIFRKMFHNIRRLI